MRKIDLEENIAYVGYGAIGSTYIVPMLTLFIIYTVMMYEWSDGILLI